MTPARKLTHNTKFKRFWMQKDTNFGITIIIRHYWPENRQNPTQKDTNFGNTIIIHHYWPENRQNPTQKDTNFGNTLIICHFGPENSQNSTQKDTNFEKMRSLTPAKMPTNKESIRFSRTLHFSHHNSNALINPIQHQPTNHFWEHLVAHFLNLQTNCDIFGQ